MVKTEGTLNTRTGEYDLIGGLFLYSHKMIWMSQQGKKPILKLEHHFVKSYLV